MKTLYEKVGYLKGLCDGVSLDKETKEGKVLLAVVDTLSDFAHAIERLQDSGASVVSLALTETGAYTCPNCQGAIDIEDSALDSEEHVVCPKCHEPILISCNEI